MARILVCLLPGLGDALTASPMVRALSTSGLQVDVLTMLEPVREYASELAFVHDVWHLPLLSAAKSALPDLWRLRSKRYDAVYLPFPATRWQYAFVARIIARHELVLHQYRGLSSALARAGAVRFVPLQGGHRAWENARLLPAGVTCASMQYEVPDSWRSTTEPGLVGVHPGSMAYKGNEARRWPAEKFLGLVSDQLSRQRRVRVFIGPNESEDLRRFAALKNHPGFEIVQASLRESARAVAQCEVFIANDAGFAHVAGALGVKTIALFGMTSPIRAQPIGRSIALRPTACVSCHDEGLRKFECVLGIGFRCMTDDFPISTVNDTIERAFAGNIQMNEPTVTSEFALYGRRYPIHL